MYLAKIDGFPGYSVDQEGSVWNGYGPGKKKVQVVVDQWGRLCVPLHQDTEELGDPMLVPVSSLIRNYWRTEATVLQC